MRGKSKARSSIEIEFRGKAHSNDWFRAILKSIDKSEPPRPKQREPYTKNIYGITADSIAFEKE